MKLSTKGSYAEMAFFDLADSSKDRPVSIADTPARQEITLHHLDKLPGTLRQGSFARPERTHAGGYMLPLNATHSHVSYGILAVDEPIRATRCKSGSPKGCKGNKGRCQTHELWEELGNQIYLYLASVSLADVVDRNVAGTLRTFPGKTTQIEEPSQVAAQ